MHQHAKGPSAKSTFCFLDSASFPGSLAVWFCYVLLIGRLPPFAGQVEDRGAVRTVLRTARSLTDDLDRKTERHVHCPTSGELRDNDAVETSTDRRYVLRRMAHPFRTPGAPTATGPSNTSASSRSNGGTEHEQTRLLSRLNLRGIRGLPFDP